MTRFFVSNEQNENLKFISKYFNPFCVQNYFENILFLLWRGVNGDIFNQISQFEELLITSVNWAQNDNGKKPLLELNHGNY